jgi:hypothetical protein
MTKANDKVKVKSVVAMVVETMTKMADKPMAETVAKLAKIVGKNGSEIGVARARAYYRTAVTEGQAPGKVERATVPAKARTPKVAKPKAPKTGSAERKELLKAAAKKAGIHKDSVAEALEGEDVLGLGAPESLSMDDLKEIL